MVLFIVAILLKPDVVYIPKTFILLDCSIIYLLASNLILLDIFLKLALVMISSLLLSELINDLFIL